MAHPSTIIICLLNALYSISYDDIPAMIAKCCFIYIISIKQVYEVVGRFSHVQFSIKRWFFNGIVLSYLVLASVSSIFDITAVLIFRKGTYNEASFGKK